jgi:hypothetical protein
MIAVALWWSVPVSYQPLQAKLCVIVLPANAIA